LRGCFFFLFFFSSRRRHTRSDRDWSSDVCSSDLARAGREQPGGRALVPGVGALLLEDVGHVASGLGGEERGLAAAAIEGRDRHAPQPLARDAPVGARRDHVPDALLAPGRVPLDLLDRTQGLRAQRLRRRPLLLLVERDEPLLRGPEDDRVLAAPADGIRVLFLAR